MKIATDTATLVIYDLDQLRHRIEDDSEWWSAEESVLQEINHGNAMFICLEEDGLYDININPSPPDDFEYDDLIVANIKNSSGKFFIGPAEAVTAEGEEPEEGKYGHFFEASPGDYELIIKAEEHSLSIWIDTIEKFEVNKFQEIPSLEEWEEYSVDDAEYMQEILESIGEHLEELGYELDEDLDNQGVVYCHPEFGYLLIEGLEGGIRFATTVDYDAGTDLKLISYDEWHTKLLEVLDRFNANATVARAYDNPEGQAVVLDSWRPAIYEEDEFEIYLDLWHDDVVNKLESAQAEVFIPKQTH